MFLQNLIKIYKHPIGKQDKSSKMKNNYTKIIHRL